jgi:predicted small metal-binding protein
MEKVLRCECGFEARADNDEALVGRARAHAKSVHGMELTAEQVLELAARAESREVEPHMALAAPPVEQPTRTKRGTTACARS